MTFATTAPVITKKPQPMLTLAAEMLEPSYSEITGPAVKLYRSDMSREPILDMRPELIMDQFDALMENLRQLAPDLGVVRRLEFFRSSDIGKGVIIYWKNHVPMVHILHAPLGNEGAMGRVVEHIVTSLGVRPETLQILQKEWDKRQGSWRGRLQPNCYEFVLSREFTRDWRMWSTYRLG